MCTEFVCVCTAYSVNNLLMRYLKFAFVIHFRIASLLVCDSIAIYGIRLELMFSLSMMVLARMLAAFSRSAGSLRVIKI